MSEGELKNRLKNMEAAGHFRDEDADGDLVDFSPSEVLSAVYSLLDEATAEWQKIEDFRYNELGQDYVSQDEARQAWFAKWFGASESRAVAGA